MSEICLAILFLCGATGLSAFLVAFAVAWIERFGKWKDDLTGERTHALQRIRLTWYEAMLVPITGMGLLMPWLLAPQEFPVFLRTEPMQLLGKALLLLVLLLQLGSLWRAHRTWSASLRLLQTCREPPAVNGLPGRR